MIDKYNSGNKGSKFFWERRVLLGLDQIATLAGTLGGDVSTLQIDLTNLTATVNANTFNINTLSASLAGAYSVASFSLSAAQIQSLNSTPVQILPAPAAGLAYIVHELVVVFTYGTVQFDTGVTIGVTNNNYAASYNRINILNSTANAAGIGSSGNTNSTNIVAVQAATALSVVADADSGAGDSTISGHIIYATITL